MLCVFMHDIIMCSVHYIAIHVLVRKKEPSSPHSAGLEQEYIGRKARGQVRGLGISTGCGECTLL